MFNVAKKTFAYGAHTVTLETGEISRQAGGAVLVSIDDTVVLCTVVGSKKVKPGQDFFPLTVDYIEKTYAAGKIPGGFFKREGRPSEKETLTSRLIDRPIRPLFPEGFYNEVQVVATVMSLNPEVDPDIAALIGTSAALSISGLPFDGPVGAARVGYIDGQYVLNPTLSQLKTSQLDLVVAGTQSAVLMVESEAKELSEEIMLGAVVFGHTEMQKVINAINELVEEAGKPEWDWQPPAKDEALIARLNELVKAKIEEAYNITVKQTRSQRLKELSAEAVAALRAGGVIAYPTEAVFGLGCDPFNRTAVEQLCLLKQRQMDQGLILIAETFSQVEDFIAPIDNAALQRVHNSWPGPYTWVFPCSARAPKWITGTHSTIALRVTAHPIAAALCTIS